MINCLQGRKYLNKSKGVSIMKQKELLDNLIRHFGFEHYKVIRFASLVEAECWDDDVMEKIYKMYMEEV